MTERDAQHSAVWCGAGPADRRLARRVRGLRVYAVLVCVAALSGRKSIRARWRH